jgi:hypothetical protein
VINIHADAWPAARQGRKVDVGDKNICKVLTIRTRQTASTIVNRSSGLQPGADEGDQRRAASVSARPLTPTASPVEGGDSDSGSTGCEAGVGAAGGASCR